MAFNKKFNAKNPLKYGKTSGKGAAYSSAYEQGPLGYSPFKQTEEETRARLLPSEHPDTYVYDGTDTREKIIDLEDRIEFINEDIFNQEGGATEQQKQDLATLRAELAKLRGE